MNHKPMKDRTVVWLLVLIVFAVAFFAGLAIAWEHMPASWKTLPKTDPASVQVPVDPAFASDSLLARQLFGQRGPAGPQIKITTAIPAIKVLDAGSWQNTGGIDQYRCTPAIGENVQEITPDHHGRILVEFLSSGTLPVMQPHDGRCEGGELALLTEDQLVALSH